METGLTLRRALKFGPTRKDIQPTNQPTNQPTKKNKMKQKSQTKQTTNVQAQTDEKQPNLTIQLRQRSTLTCRARCSLSLESLLTFHSKPTKRYNQRIRSLSSRSRQKSQERVLNLYLSRASSHVHIGELALLNPGRWGRPPEPVHIGLGSPPKETNPPAKNKNKTTGGRTG